MSQRDEIQSFMRVATQAQASLVTKRLALEVLSGVVRMTPVDTGRARGNWQTHLKAGTTTEVENLDPSGNSTVSAGAAVISQQTGFDRIVLDNNLPYISRLEDGYSKQAPNGMVAMTLASMGLTTGRDE